MKNLKNIIREAIQSSDDDSVLFLKNFSNILKDTINDSKEILFGLHNNDWQKKEYTIILNDDSEITLWFYKSGVFSTFHNPSSKNSTLAYKLQEKLLPYLSRDTKAIKNSQKSKMQAVFIAFANAVNNKKKESLKTEVKIKNDDIQSYGSVLKKWIPQIREIVNVEHGFPKAKGMVRYDLHLLDGTLTAIVFKDGKIFSISSIGGKSSTLAMDIRSFYGTSNTHAIFVAFMNATNNRKNNNLTEESKPSIIKDFFEALGQFKNDIKIVKFAKTDSDGGNIYFIDTNDGGEITMFFNDDGSYDSTLFSKRTITVEKIREVLSQFGKDGARNSYGHNIEVVFKTFKNLIDSRNNNEVKEISEYNFQRKLNKSKKFLSKDFVKTLKELESEILSIEKSKYLGKHNYEVYEAELNNGLKLLFEFTPEGKPYMVSLSVNRDNEHYYSTNEKANYFDNRFRYFKNKQGSEIARAIFLAFANMINSKNQKGIDEISATANGKLDLTEFGNNLKKLYPFITSIKEGRYEHDRIDYGAFLEGGSIINFVFTGNRLNTIRFFKLIDNLSKVEMRAITKLVKQSRNVPGNLLNAERAHNIFKAFVEAVNNKPKQTNIKEAKFNLHKNSPLEDFLTMLNKIKKVINTIEYNDAPKYFGENMYIINTNDGGEAHMFFKDGGLADTEQGGVYAKGRQAKWIKNILIPFSFDNASKYFGAEHVFKTFMNLINSKKTK